MISEEALVPACTDWAVAKQPGSMAGTHGGFQDPCWLAWVWCTWATCWACLAGVGGGGLVLFLDLVLSPECIEVALGKEGLGD